MFVAQQGICKAQSVNFVLKKKKNGADELNYWTSGHELCLWAILLNTNAPQSAQSQIKPHLVWLKQPCEPQTPLGSLRSKVGGNNSSLKHLGPVPRFLTHSALSPYSHCSGSFTWAYSTSVQTLTAPEAAVSSKKSVPSPMTSLNFAGIILSSLMRHCIPLPITAHAKIRQRKMKQAVSISLLSRCGWAWASLQKLYRPHFWQILGYINKQATWPELP